MQNIFLLFSVLFSVNAFCEPVIFREENMPELVIPEAGKGPVKVSIPPFKLFWTGKFGETTLNYTSNSVTRQKGAKLEQLYRLNPKDSASNYASYNNVRLMAVVGNHMTLRMDDVYRSARTSSASSNDDDIGRRIDYRTVRILDDKPIDIIKPIALTDIYDEPTLLSSIAQSPQVRKILNMVGRSESPTSLQTFHSALEQLRISSNSERDGITNKVFSCLR